MLAAVGAMACAGVLYRSEAWRIIFPAAPSASQLEETSIRLRLREAYREAELLRRAGKYTAAAQKFEAAWREASRAGDEENAVRFLNNLGACYMAAFRYREAMAAYLAARDLARKRQDWEAAAGLEGNISALYAQMGEVNSALQAAESGLALLKNRPAPKYRPKLLSLLGTLRAETGQLDTAVGLFSEAIHEADRQADSATQAQAWNRLGYELVRAGELQAAEHALLEAFRLRSFTKDKAILLSYRTLGLLRMAQGDLDSACHLLDQAVALAAASPRLVPFWQLHHDRGRVRMAQGRLGEALEDFRLAVDSARRWRPEVLPADPVRVSLEAGLQQVYSSFIEAGNRLYFLGGDASLARQTFEVAADNRAHSLRMLVAEPEEWRQKLPPEYGETLARLRQAEVALLNGDSAAAASQIPKLHHQLTEMEARAGLDSPNFADGLDATGNLADRVQKLLAPDEALLSFHLGDRTSYLWSITRDSFELTKLPARSHIAGQVRRFLDALGGWDQAAGSLAGELHGALLSGLTGAVRSKPHWLLALDDALFELPFAALADNSGPGGPRYLVERHSLQVVPGAHLLVSARTGQRRDDAPGGFFLGVGDPVYNTADPRWQGQTQGRRGRAQPLELPRLAGSSREIHACARLWTASSPPPVLLEGPGASRQELFRRLEGRPAVAHFATHVVPSREKRGLIALSLLPNGEAELLTPLDIASQRRAPGLVVLSGCGSAQGKILPGAGLMGLTRAWLAAGAQTVVASRWPTPDDSGDLFLSFYRRLRSSGNVHPAAALREAQLEMVRSRSWRSLPKYWAAYLAVGKG